MSRSGDFSDDDRQMIDRQNRLLYTLMHVCMGVITRVYDIVLDLDMHVCKVILQ